MVQFINTKNIINNDKKYAFNGSILSQTSKIYGCILDNNGVNVLKDKG